MVLSRASLAGIVLVLDAAGAVRNIAPEDATGTEQNVIRDALVADIVGAVAIDAVGDPAVGHAEIVVEGEVGLALAADIRSRAGTAVIDGTVGRACIGSFVENVAQFADSAGDSSVGGVARRAVHHAAEVANSLIGEVISHASSAVIVCRTRSTICQVTGHA